MGLEQYQFDIRMCCRCSACKFIPMQKVAGSDYSYVCPSIAKYNFHAYSAGGRLNIANWQLHNEFDFTPQVLDVIKNCQMCGACGVSCNYAMDMEVMNPIQEFRIKSVEKGHTIASLDKTLELLRKENTMVEPVGKRGDWAKGLEIKDATKEKVEVLYHVGCLTSYDKNMHKIARATAKILKKAGADFGIAGDSEMCCGGRAYQMGYREDFLKQAKKNMALIKKAGVKTVVTSCADGYQAFKVLYDQYNLKGDLEVLHTTEYFARLVQEGKLKPMKDVDLTITYHDPCRLGRLGEPWIHWEGKKVQGGRFVFDPPKTYRRGTNGVYEEPRELLESIPGIQLREMVRIKEYAWCCGAGGGVSESNPDFANWTAQKRIEEAIDSGAEAMVTACPWCEKTFRSAVDAKGESLEIFDIVELIEKSI